MGLEVVFEDSGDAGVFEGLDAPDADVVGFFWVHACEEEFEEGWVESHGVLLGVVSWWFVRVFCRWRLRIGGRGGRILRRLCRGCGGLRLARVRS